MTKPRAFTLHLATSTLIFVAFLGVMFFVWYPAPYFEIDGGWRVLRILAGVDVVLGPLLTLILFKPGKPGLKLDLSCIVLMQVGALVYGGTIIYQQRPAFVVFSIDRFTTVAAAEVDFDQLKYPTLHRTIGIGPQLAQVRLPQEPKSQQELLFGVLMKGEKDIEFRSEFYEPYKPDLQALRSRGIDIQKISTLDATAKQAVEQFITRRGGRLEDDLYLPLKGKNKDIVVVLSPKDGLPVDFIGISPWIEDYPTRAE